MAVFQGRGALGPNIDPRSVIIQWDRILGNAIGAAKATHDIKMDVEKMKFQKKMNDAELQRIELARDRLDHQIKQEKQIATWAKEDREIDQNNLKENQDKIREFGSLPTSVDNYAEWEARFDPTNKYDMQVIINGRNSLKTQFELPSDKMQQLSEEAGILRKRVESRQLQATLGLMDITEEIQFTELETRANEALKRNRRSRLSAKMQTLEDVDLQNFKENATFAAIRNISIADAQKARSKLGELQFQQELRTLKADEEATDITQKMLGIQKKQFERKIQGFGDSGAFAALTEEAAKDPVQYNAKIKEINTDRMQRLNALIPHLDGKPKAQAKKMVQILETMEDYHEAGFFRQAGHQAATLLEQVGEYALLIGTVGIAPWLDEDLRPWQTGQAEIAGDMRIIWLREAFQARLAGDISKARMLEGNVYGPVDAFLEKRGQLDTTTEKELRQLEVLGARRALIQESVRPADQGSQVVNPANPDNI